MIRRKIRWTTFSCAFLMALGLVGCAPHLFPATPDREEMYVPTMDLAQAKAQTLAWTAVLMDAVPVDDVDESWSHEEGVLMSCSSDSFQWASAAEITMKDEQDLTLRLKAMASAWTEATDLPAAFEKTGRGNPRLVVTGPGSAIIAIDAREDRRRLALSSFSSCVTDLADYDGGYSY